MSLVQSDSAGVYYSTQLIQSLAFEPLTQFTMESDNSKGVSVRPVEKLMLEPLQSVFRIVYGFCLSQAISRWRGRDVLWWELCLLFLVALVLLRVAPIIPRKILPFSKAVKAAWFDQRQLAKRYDSYQWAKLLWIGIGIGVHAVYTGSLRTQLGLLAVGCILAGGVGTVFWLRAQSAVKSMVAVSNG